MNFQNAQGVQRRTQATELRADAKQYIISGYAAVYGVWSHNLGGFCEQLAPHAFDRVLKTNPDVRCLLNHNASGLPLGRTKNGTLTLSSDDRGLRFRCQLDRNSQTHNDVFGAIERGDITDMSFAFGVDKAGQMWASGKDPETGEACQLRTIVEIKELMDVSPVCFPAYPQTSVGARNQRSRANYGLPAQAANAGAPNLGAQNRFRQLAQAYSREFLLAFNKVWAAVHLSETRQPSGMDEVIGFASRLERAHLGAEMCGVLVREAKDCLDGCEDDEADDDTRAAFARALAATEACCSNLADARNAHGRHKQTVGKLTKGNIAKILN
jgi:uncharacterized protein